MWKRDTNELGGAVPMAPASGAAARQGAYIGKGIVFEGNISGADDVYVDGEVTGRIDLPGHHIVVGPDASVAADLNGKTISISGTVVGNITATERAAITESGSVQGNVRAPRVSVEDGASFGGRVETAQSTVVSDASASHLRLVAS